MHNLIIPEPHTSPQYPYLILHHIIKTKQYNSFPHHYNTLRIVTTTRLHSTYTMHLIQNHYITLPFSTHTTISIQYHSYPPLYTTSQYHYISLLHFTATTTHMIHLIHNQYHTLRHNTLTLLYLTVPSHYFASQCHYLYITLYPYADTFM